MAGTTDFRTISESDDPKCKLVYDLFLDRILGFVGSYYVKLEGQVDALVFAGGIGEKSSRLRADVVKGCRCIGFEIDEAKNSKPEDISVTDIGASSARHRTLICQTDEQVRLEQLSHSICHLLMVILV